MKILVNAIPNYNSMPVQVRELERHQRGDDDETPNAEPRRLAGCAYSLLRLEQADDEFGEVRILR